MSKHLLEINDLTIHPKNNPDLLLVKDVSLKLREGKTTCIVGESGSGKSLTALAIIRLLSSQLSVSGEFLLRGENLTLVSEEVMREKRGQEIAMIFQEPMTSLNPVLSIGYQIQEAIGVHSKLDQEHRSGSFKPSARPTRVSRIHTLKNPGSRQLKTSLRLGEIAP